MTQNASPGGISPDEFKRGLRQLAAAVTVVSTLREDGVPAGLLATAVCSVSVTPPTLLACINRTARSFSAIEASGYFCVNVLERGQLEAARQFLSLDHDERFRLFKWSGLETGAPAIDGALVIFDCKVVQAIPAETHMILLGRVTASRIASEGVPLLYFSGDYAGLAAAGAVGARPGP
jgi:flavin reductase (DIM6/NTAB) family NADH-FMN oxidoreductase RutF